MRRPARLRVRNHVLQMLDRLLMEVKSRPIVSAKRNKNVDDSPAPRRGNSKNKRPPK